MSFDRSQLRPYMQQNADLIPIHTWNKRIKGVERGKTPIHSDWVKREYNYKDYPNWVKKGYNLGYRIGKNEAVVDLDPRNYEGHDCSQMVAELFGYFDIDELCEDLPVVKTGGGGYHIYCKLPKGADYKNYKETIDSLPGVELKRHGRQVLTAGSKHPSGKFYKWINDFTDANKEIIPDELITLFFRELKEKNPDHSDGRGVLTGAQLTELVLDKLDPYQYNTNDSWWPILCGAHHVTDGEGIDEFVSWCLEDEQYSDAENQIRARWESLSQKGNEITVGSLIHALKQSGAEADNLKAVLSFSSLPDLNDFEDFQDEDNEEAVLLKEAQEVADEIDVQDMYELPAGEAGVEGAATQAANALNPSSSNEDVMKTMRLIKAADELEAIRAQEIILEKKLLKQGSMNKLLKGMDAKIIDDLALLVSQKTLEKTFNNAKHLTAPPSGMLWAYHKTHWRPMSDEFLSRMIQNVLHILKKKMKIEANELVLITQAVKLSRIQVSTLTDRIHRTTLPPSVVNCKNGELWIDKEGGHDLRQHNYRSYLLNCLNVDYDPSAQCPLFVKTLTEIFNHFPDTEDMVRHIGEILGYTIQPRKNIASWWLFRGPGGDGKSTILKVLGGILQDAMLMTTVKILAAGSTSANNHATMSLVGKLGVAIEELPANAMLKDEGVKMFSENTKMEVNPKAKDPYDFMYAGNLIMCSNGFPAIRDLSHGMIRRANVVPFNRQFDLNGLDDLDRAEKILSNPKEMAGVLNFMLAGLQRLRDRGKFKPPVSCAKAKKEWLGEANNIIRFMDETATRTSNQEDCLGDLGSFYGMHYNMWCDDNGIEENYRKKKTHFMKDLENLGWKIRRGGGNVVKIYGGLLVGHTGGVAEVEDEGCMDKW